MRMQESERRGLDILFAIDTSRSMLTPDVKPDRLTRARLAVEDLLDQLNGDGVGLVAFAGEAFLQAPVTTDYDAFKESLDALDTHTIALGGTDIAAAIRLSESTLALRGDTQKVLVLITDGEDLAGDALLAAQAAAKKGMVIFTVGVGTAAGELIPIPDSLRGHRSLSKTLMATSSNRAWTRTCCGKSPPPRAAYIPLSARKARGSCSCTRTSSRA